VDIRRIFKKETKTKFCKQPLALMLQIPRSGTKTRVYKSILPSQRINISSHMYNSTSTLNVSQYSLQSIICIDISHYVTFTRCNEEWYFFDSMAERIGNKNIPKVTHLPNFIKNFNMDNKIHHSPKEFERLCNDMFLCIYVPEH